MRNLGRCVVARILNDIADQNVLMNTRVPDGGGQSDLAGARLILQNRDIPNLGQRSNLDVRLRLRPEIGRETATRRCAHCVFAPG